MEILDTKSRIINSARELFHNRSYGDVGVKQICDQAKIQKGSFYHFFPSKRDLALEVIELVSNDWANGFIAEAFDPDLPPIDRLDNVIFAAYYWQKAAKNIEGHMPGCLFGNLVLEMSTRDDILRSKLNAVFSRAKGKFRETLEQAVETGALAPLDIEASSEAMLAYLEGIILLAKSRNDPEVINNLGSAIKTLRIEIESN